LFIPQVEFFRGLSAIGDDPSRQQIQSQDQRVCTWLSVGSIGVMVARGIVETMSTSDYPQMAAARGRIEARKLHGDASAVFIEPNVDRRAQYFDGVDHGREIELNLDGRGGRIGGDRFHGESRRCDHEMRSFRQRAFEGAIGSGETAQDAERSHDGNLGAVNARAGGIDYRAVDEFIVCE